MTHDRLQEELATLRRQIALLQSREARIAASLEEEAPRTGLRPGWPIQRLQQQTAVMPQAH
ncbi:MAG: hypothetical protein MUF74_13775 [Cypionkella sp.]|jgi:hypothetical protein|nr:hypothetical protein [Cypionkella sp.]